MFQTLVARCVNSLCTDSFTINSEDTITLVNVGADTVGVIQKVGEDGWEDTATTFAVPSGTTVLTLDSTDIAFGPNGARLKLDVTSTVGVFTSDSIGNQATGGLSFLPTRETGGKATADLAVTDTLDLCYGGQSNASKQAVVVERDWAPSQTFTTEVNYFSAGGSGFANGQWGLGTDYEQQLIDQINAMDPSHWSPGLIWIHGENDSNTVEGGEAYLSNVLQLKETLALRTGYDVPWIVVRLNSALANPAVTQVREAQTKLAELSDVTLIDIDEFAFNDGTHYDDSVYLAGIFPKILEVINREKLLHQHGQYISQYATRNDIADPLPSSPFLVQALFNAPIGTQVASYTPDVGSFDVIRGDWEINSTGDGIITGTNSPGGTSSYVLTFDQVGTGLVEHNVSCELNESTFSGVAIRYVDENNYIFAGVQGATAFTGWRVRVMQYIDGVLTVLDSTNDAAEVVPLLINVTDDGSTITVDVGGTTATATTSQFAGSREAGLVSNNAGNQFYSYTAEVVGE